jgi:hypothetical protein
MLTVVLVFELIPLLNVRSYLNQIPIGNIHHPLPLLYDNQLNTRLPPLKSRISHWIYADALGNLPPPSTTEEREGTTSNDTYPSPLQSFFDKIYNNGSTTSGTTDEIFEYERTIQKQQRW